MKPTDATAMTATTVATVPRSVFCSQRTAPTIGPDPLGSAAYCCAIATCGKSSTPIAKCPNLVSACPVRFRRFRPDTPTALSREQRSGCLINPVWRCGSADAMLSGYRRLDDLIRTLFFWRHQRIRSPVCMWVMAVPSAQSSASTCCTRHSRDPATVTPTQAMEHVIPKHR